MTRVRGIHDCISASWKKPLEREASRSAEMVSCRDFSSDIVGIVNASRLSGCCCAASTGSSTRGVVMSDEGQDNSDRGTVCNYSPEFGQYFPPPDTFGGQATVAIATNDSDVGCRSPKLVGYPLLWVICSLASAGRGGRGRRRHRVCVVVWPTRPDPHQTCSTPTIPKWLQQKSQRPRNH